jgi:hypothetical protein
MGGKLRNEGCKHWEVRNLYKVLVGKPEGKRPLERSVRRLQVNVKKDLKETVCEDVDWIQLTLRRSR